MRYNETPAGDPQCQRSEIQEQKASMDLLTTGLLYQIGKGTTNGCGASFFAQGEAGIMKT